MLSSTSVIAPTKTAPRYLYLDVLRAVAVLMVLLSHQPEDMIGSHDWMLKLRSMGWAGVELFFVLSGFLISGLLFSEWDRKNKIALRRFYIRRFIKIQPLFYLLIASTFFLNKFYVVMPYPEWKEVLVEILFVQNYFGSIWTPTWSLGIEEHFYVIFPLALIFVIRKTPTLFAHLDRYLLGFIALVWLGRIFCWLLGSVSNEHIYLYTHLRADSLCFGVWLSYVYRYRKDRVLAFLRFSSAWLGLCSAGVFIGVIWFFSRLSDVMPCVGYSLLYIASGGMLLACSKISFAGRIWEGAGAVGQASYMIYLWHLPFLYFIRFYLCLHFKFDYLGFFVCYYAGSVLFGYFLHRALENPLLRLRNRYFP